MIRYAQTFNLNVLLSSSIKSTAYDYILKKWTLKLVCPGGEKTIVCKQLVQATGVGSRVPYLPKIENEGKYKGISMHSAEFKNAKQLVGKVKVSSCRFSKID